MIQDRHLSTRSRCLAARSYSANSGGRALSPHTYNCAPTQQGKKGLPAKRGSRKTAQEGLSNDAIGTSCQARSTYKTQRHNKHTKQAGHDRHRLPVCLGVPTDEGMCMLRGPCTQGDTGDAATVCRPSCVLQHDMGGDRHTGTQTHCWDNSTLLTAALPTTRWHNMPQRCEQQQLTNRNTPCGWSADTLPLTHLPGTQATHKIWRTQAALHLTSKRKQHALAHQQHSLQLLDPTLCVKQTLQATQAPAHTQNPLAGCGVRKRQPVSPHPCLRT